MVKDQLVYKIWTNHNWPLPQPLPLPKLQAVAGYAQCLGCLRDSLEGMVSSK